MTKPFLIPEAPTDEEIALYYANSNGVGAQLMRNKMLPHQLAAKIMFEALQFYANELSFLGYDIEPYVRELARDSIARVEALYNVTGGNNE